MGRNRDQTAPRLLGAIAVALVFAGCASKPDAGGGAHRLAPAGGGTEDAGGQASSEEAEQIAAIEQAVNEFSRAVHSCWAIGASDDFRLEGKVVLTLAIGPGGSSAGVEVVSDEPGDPRLTGCLRELWADYTWPDVFREGDQIQLPPFEFVAPKAQYTVSTAHVKPTALERGKLEVSDVLDEKNTGNGAGTMSVLRAQDGVELPLRSHPYAELFFIFSGQAEIWDARGERRAKRAGPGTGVYIQAGAPHGWRQVPGEALVLLRFAAPGGEAARFGAEEGTEALEKKKLGRKRARSRPTIRAAKGAPKHAVAGGAGEAVILFDAASAGDDAASLGAITLEAGAAIPRHRHAESSEYVFLIEGLGEMHVGEETFSVGGGDAIQVPPGVEHAFEVSGEGPVKAIQLYAPAGPEQRYKQAEGSD